MKLPTNFIYIRTFFFCCILLFSLNSSKATHIVGGELNYECLGNDTYRISLTVFRDCFNGNPNAYFDDPASIGIFDGNNNLVTSLGTNGQLLIPLMNDDTLDPTLFDSCLVVPPDVCVHRTTYTDVVVLPFLPGGYQLSYQRCCRNQTIQNIVDPLGTGATYYNAISEEALTGCNNSAVFKEWPPNYICVNEPILFDHGALDVDGDSLVYSLCTPFDGASPDNPQPQPPNPPPYDDVIWLNPPYDVNDMMGGTPLFIDSETGFLTGTPNTTGQFVVGICVEEYRDGILISTTKRDFQYNVGVCGEAISSFFAPAVDCDGFTVNFDNQSQDAVDFIWDFGDLTTTTDVSTATNPTYTYPDTGLYEITMIAGPNELCADTSYSTVSVQIPSLFVDFDLSIIDGCVYPAQVSFDDLSFDTISNIVEWDWQFSNGDTSDLENPIWFVTQNGTFSATLTVTAANGCQVSHTDFISITVLELGLQDTANICLNESVILNPGTDPTYTYNWSPGGTLSSTTSPSPQASPINNTTYYVTVEDNDGCFYTDSIEVIVTDLVIDFDDQIDICVGDTIALHDGTETDLTYTWTPDINLIDANSGTASAFPEVETVYYVNVVTDFGCEYQDSVRVLPIIEEEVMDNFVICAGESAALNPNPNLDYSYTWTPSESLNNPTIPNPIATPDSTITYIVDILDNPTGCVRTEEVVLTVNQLPTIPTDSIDACIDVAGGLNPEGNPAYIYNWSPGTGLDDPTAPNPIATLDSGGSATYYVTIEDNIGCINNDSIAVTVIDLIIDFDDEIPICVGDTVSLHDGTESDLTYSWTPDINLIDANSGTASAYPEVETVYYVDVVNDFGCVYEDSVRLVPVIIEQTTEDFTICDGESVSLNPNPDMTYTYTWSPSETLDDSTAPNPIATPDGTTTYTVEILDSSAGCIRIEEVLLIVDPLPSIPNDSIDACRNVVEELNPGADPVFNYTWSPSTGLDDATAPNPNVTMTLNGNSTYYVTIVNPNTGCEYFDSINVFVPIDITVEASDDEVVCEASLDISATTNTGLDFEWYSDPALTTNIGSGATIEVTPGESSTYYVVSTDEYGCIATDDVQVGSQAVNVDVPAQVTVCEDNSFSIEAINLKPDDMLSYEWIPDSVIVSGANTSNPTFFMEEDDIVTLVVENQYGCFDTLLIPVDVIENDLGIIATADPDTIYPGESSQLNASPDLVNYTFMWTNGDVLDDDMIADPIATPPVTTTFDVFVESDIGCKDTSSVTVYLRDFFCDAPYIFVPNAFTPDGDGMNDVFYVRGNAVDEMFMTVYNRWGEKIFETTDLNTGWDGTYKGKELAPDVYGYYLQLRCLNGEEYFTKGNVTLIR